MYNSQLENQLIILDIEDVMQDFVPIQFDIDPTKLKAAQKLAIDLELTKFIKQEHIDRCIDQDDPSEADTKLLNLIVPALCHFTYEKCLSYFQGSLYNSGYSEEENAKTRAEAKSAASQANSFGNQYMTKVVEFLEAENPSEEKVVDSSPTVEAIGGQEHWGHDYRGTLRNSMR